MNIRSIKILALVLVLMVSMLTSCGKETKTDGKVKSISKGNTSSEAIKNESVIETSSIDIASSASEEPPPKEYDDLLFKIKGKGKELVVFGDLKDQKYSKPLNELEKILKEYNRDVSLVAYSLDNRKALGFNTQAEIFAACTVKAAYALYCCKQMEKGTGSLDTKMTYLEKHFESGAGDMQYSPFGTEFSMKTIIEKSLGISDNVGYMMMADYFGRDGYNEWIDKLGCPSLKIEPTVWSLRTKARDLVAVWREIYKYFEENSEYSEFLYNCCTNTGNNFLTASLKNVTYSHKEGHESRGDWLSFSDAGIIWKENEPYIVAIITNAPGPSFYDSEMMNSAMKILHKKIFN